MFGRRKDSVIRISPSKVVPVFLAFCVVVGACNADGPSSRHSVTPSSSSPVAVPTGQHRLALDQPTPVGPLVLTFKGVERVYMAQGSPQMHLTSLVVEVAEGDDQRRVGFGEGTEFNTPREAFGVLLRMVGPLEEQKDAATIEILTANSNADCSSVCMFGKCTAKDGRCVVGSDADCAGALGCAASGLCIARSGVCVVGDDTACKTSRECTTAGLCFAREGRCAAAAQDDCTRSENCKKYGQCTFDTDHCGLGSDADCKASGACAARGECKFVAGKCSPGSAADCRQSKLCDQGRCDLRAGSCVFGSQQDCDKDPTWGGHSLYEASTGSCAPQCAKSSVCIDLGKCTPKDGRCATTSDAECRASTYCKSEGNCHAYVEAGFCGAGTDADCKNSEECKSKGNCTLRAGDVHCRPGSDADCRASLACTSSGLCKAGLIACE